VSCQHPRAFFYQQRMRIVAKRPVIPIVERCLGCGALLRDKVPASEIRDANLLPSMLVVDPWEGR
jgi:hypothetical protein